MMQTDFDVIVVGAGSAGVAAAISSARAGAKTLLMERNGFLGGTAVASMVIPMMPNQSKGKNLVDGLYEELLGELSVKYSGAARFSDNNPGWVNPELMKVFLDEACLREGITLCFNTELVDVAVEHRDDMTVMTSITGLFRGQKRKISARQFIDASGNADLSYLAGAQMLTDPGRQAMSLRFMMGGIDLARHAAWLEEVDPEMANSAVFHHPNGHWMLSTAYVSDSPGWVLKPWFDEGLAEGLITPAEAAYFQIFSVPGMPGTVSFNCPRIVSDLPLDPLSSEDTAYAYVTGRQQIVRLATFCQKKLPGFEQAYLSQVAPELGIRESRRVKGRYVITDEDILACRKFDDAVAKCAYPIDIHQASPNADKGGLQKLREGDYYEVPLRALQVKGFENLLMAGRCISATFVAQSSLRIQPVCWAMGEAVGRVAARASL